MKMNQLEPGLVVHVHQRHEHASPNISCTSVMSTYTIIHMPPNHIANSVNLVDIDKGIVATPLKHT